MHYTRIAISSASGDCYASKSFDLVPLPTPFFSHFTSMSANSLLIIYRDLKPQNLLLFNQGRTIKISDFGTTRNLTAHTMSQKGSIQWMPPELKTGKFDEKADTYSFGIIIWQMATREEPYVQYIPQLNIPGDPEVLVDLMVKMYDQEAGRRPKMVKVIDKLEKISSRYHRGK